MLYFQACEVTLTLNIVFSASAPNPRSVALLIMETDKYPPSLRLPPFSDESNLTVVSTLIRSSKSPHRRSQMSNMLLICCGEELMLPVDAMLVPPLVAAGLTTSVVACLPLSVSE